MYWATINTKVDELAGTDTNTYPNANRAINANIANNMVIRALLGVSADDYDDYNHTDLPVLTFPLDTSRIQTIPVTEAVLKIKRLDISYDGVNYYQATQLDSERIESLGNDDKVDVNFQQSSPCYDILGDSLFIYPRATADQTNATCRIEWVRAPVEVATADMTSTSKAPGVDGIYHDVYADIMSAEWMRGKPQKFDVMDRLKQDIMIKLASIASNYNKKSVQTPQRLSALYVDYE